MTLQCTASGELLRLADGSLMSECCCGPEVECPNPWEWTYTDYSGASWTQYTETHLRIDYQDSPECGGANDAVQGGTAETCVIAPIDGFLIIDAIGSVETEDTGYDVLDVVVDDVNVLSLASVGVEGGCAMETRTGQACVPVLAGQVLRILVDSSTIDGRWHKDAYWDVQFSFDSVCEETPSEVSVSLWFISEQSAEYSIRLTYDGSPYAAFPGFEDATGPIAWYNSVPSTFATPGAHIALLTATLPNDPATWLTLWDPAISRWLLQVDIGTRKKYFVSRSDPSDAANVIAWAEAGYEASYTVVGSVTLGSMTNQWDFTLPGDALL